MYKKIVIGIDQSYQDTGISVFADKKKKAIRDVKLSQYRNNSERREVLREYLGSFLTSVAEIAKENDGELICIIERIRLQSQGFLSIDYIKSMGALNSIIVDSCDKISIPTYSVDTRAWKSQVVGTSKPYDRDYYGIDPHKVPTILWCIRNGWVDDIKEPVSAKKKKGVIVKGDERFTYNDNKADSAGIAMYGFVGNAKGLKEES